MRAEVYRRDEKSDTPAIKAASSGATSPAITRVLASETFRRAPRLKSLLAYLWDRASCGRTAELGEQQIGTAVFGRAVNYDCANDNIVRVTVRQLRLKLQEYYEGEGATEQEKIVIPKGFYVPELVTRHPDVQQPHAQYVEAPHLAGMAEHVEIASAVTPHPPVEHTRIFHIWRWLAIGSLTLAVVFAALAILASRSVRRIPVNESNWTASNNLVKALILTPRQRTPIVLGDANLQALQEITGRVISLDDYLNGNLVRSTTDGSLPNGIAGLLSSRRSMEAADVIAATKILQANPEQVQSLTVGGPNSIAAQDLRAGNAILLGNPRSNPWIAILTPSLNFQISYPAAGHTSFIRNLASKPGEPTQYNAQQTGNAATQYGLVAVLPNLSGSGFVLIIGGTTPGAVASAAEFVCHPEAAQRVAGLFHIDNLQQIAGFEVVLKIESIENIPRVIQVVASRVTMRTRG